MSGEPTSNIDHFRHRPVNEIAALLPDKQAVSTVIQDLREADVDVSGVQVLHGEEGARILDRSGTEHGFVNRLVRFLQNLGYDQNILAVYEESLQRGEGLITVPCTPDDRHRVGQLVIRRGGHGVIYFGAGTAETLTQP